MEVTEILLIPATIIASVVLVASCLLLKKLRGKARNDLSVPKKTKSGESTKHEENSQITGITNTAFTVDNVDADIYENDENVYDYAKTERGMGMKYGLGLQSNGTNEEKFPVTSPVYADANDTNTRFYFTLERSSSTGITNNDEGDYVIPIPDNIYDKPEEDETLNMQDAKNGSQFYFTLEECSEENDKELSVKNIVAQEENEDANDDIYDTAEETYENGTQDVSIDIQEQDEINNDETYVINIPNNVNDRSRESKEDSIKATEIEEMHVIEIPNDSNDLSLPEKGDEYSGRIRTEDNNDGYLIQSGAEEDNATTKKTVNPRPKDEFSQLDSTEIYQNVSECFYTEINGNEANKNAKTSEQNTVHSQENMGYIDDEISTQNKTEQNGMNNENCHEIHVETFTSDSKKCLSDNDTRNDDECYLDDDIYENWEENIIGRLSGESKEDLNELVDFDIIKDQPSGCFYENLRHSRPSLVLQDIR